MKAETSNDFKSLEAKVVTSNGTNNGHNNGFSKNLSKNAEQQVGQETLEEIKEHVEQTRRMVARALLITPNTPRAKGNMYPLTVWLQKKLGLLAGLTEASTKIQLSCNELQSSLTAIEQQIHERNLHPQGPKRSMSPYDDFDLVVKDLKDFVQERTDSIRRSQLIISTALALIVIGNTLVLLTGSLSPF